MKCLYEEETDMRYTLENENLKVEIDSFGAEIKSVKENQITLNICGVVIKVLGQNIPVLFPFVGAPKNKEYRYDGKTYTMGQHGFARDMEFTLESQTEENISFVLTDTAETCEKYPFHFALHIGYELCKNEVKVNWTVENTDTKELYFSIGAHPAFNCPVHGEENKTGYGLKFGGLADTIHHHGNTPDGMAVMEDKVLALKDGCVTFTEGFFDECTYMVEGKQTGEVSCLTVKASRM